MVASHRRLLLVICHHWVFALRWAGCCCGRSPLLSSLCCVPLVRKICALCSMNNEKLKQNILCNFSYLSSWNCAASSFKLALGSSSWMEKIYETFSLSLLRSHWDCVLQVLNWNTTSSTAEFRNANKFLIHYFVALFSENFCDLWFSPHLEFSVLFSCQIFNQNFKLSAALGRIWKWFQCFKKYYTMEECRMRLIIVSCHSWLSLGVSVVFIASFCQCVSIDMTEQASTEGFIWAFQSFLCGFCGRQHSLTTGQLADLSELCIDRRHSSDAHGKVWDDRESQRKRTGFSIIHVALFILCQTLLWGFVISLALKCG